MRSEPRSKPAVSSETTPEMKFWEELEQLTVRQRDASSLLKQTYVSRITVTIILAKRQLDVDSISAPCLNMNPFSLLDLGHTQSAGRVSEWMSPRTK